MLPRGSMDIRILAKLYTITSIRSQLTMILLLTYRKKQKRIMGSSESMLPRTLEGARSRSEESLIKKARTDPQASHFAIRMIRGSSVWILFMMDRPTECVCPCFEMLSLIQKQPVPASCAACTYPTGHWDCSTNVILQ